MSRAALVKDLLVSAIRALWLESINVVMVEPIALMEVMNTIAKTVWLPSLVLRKSEAINESVCEETWSATAFRIVMMARTNLPIAARNANQMSTSARTTTVAFQMSSDAMEMITVRLEMTRLVVLLVLAERSFVLWLKSAFLFGKFAMESSIVPTNLTKWIVTVKLVLAATPHCAKERKLTCASKRATFVTEFRNARTEKMKKNALEAVRKLLMLLLTIMTFNAATEITTLGSTRVQDSIQNVKVLVRNATRSWLSNALTIQLAFIEVKFVMAVLIVPIRATRRIALPWRKIATLRKLVVMPLPIATTVETRLTAKSAKSRLSIV